MKPKFARGNTAADASKAHRHAKAARRHRKNPCGHSPAVPENLFGEFLKHPGHRRHNKWHAHLRWKEVTTDIDGLPVLVVTYKIVVEYSANGTDWFVHQRFTINGRDDDQDPNSTDTLKITRGIDGKLAYRFKVKAIEANGCPSAYSDHYDLGTPNDVPPAPSNVKILRVSHGIRLRWRVPPETTDDDLFAKDVAHFLVELWTNEDFGPTLAFTATNAGDEFTATTHGFNNGDPVMLRNSRADEGDHNSASQDDLPTGVDPYKLYYITNAATDTFKLAREEDSAAIVLTSDGDGKVMWGEVRHARHVHHHHHNFRVDADDFDEDVHFFGRVCSVSSDGSKSAFIPATAPVANDDPDATPTGRRPAWHRRVMTFNIPGAFQVGTYNPPNRFDDDYILRRLTGVVDTVATGGATKVDIVVDSGAGYASIFEDDDADMLTFSAGDADGSTKAIHERTVNAGDHFKAKVVSIGGTAPENGTLHLIADRGKADP